MTTIALIVGTWLTLLNLDGALWSGSLDSKEAEVLGFASGVRHREEELRRAFFSARFVKVLDTLGYARFTHWRVYDEEALAGREAALWLAAESLAVEYAGEPLSRYDARLAPDGGELRYLTRPRPFGSSRVRPQLRLFALDALGRRAG